ncbi:MAG TPA: ATP-binding protein [Candidatus Sulfotelmatobacter sp.]|nr:ATP-binding protein [Candidatus Sulfotelmatobacter sp.]
MARWRAPDWVIWLSALAGPALLTAVLIPVTGADRRNYVFLYLGLVAVVGVLRGLWPALLAAAASFALLDYFFTVPYYTFTMSRPEDVLNLAIFVVMAVLVGILASRRRTALLEAEALTRQLREVNGELVRLNKEQAEAAQAALRLARSEQQIHALQETDRLRRELLANVSHELRTPLGTILTESTDPSKERSPDEMKHSLDTIAAEARRLNALVADMLDMTIIEGGALELDLVPLDLDDAIEAAAERLHRASPDRQVAWDRDAARVDVLADWERLGQVFDNLLSNADRFAPHSTPISVAVAHEQSGVVTVRVSDRGPGIPADLRERIFERFFRGAGNGNSGGTGLGLAIVKGLVEAHAGTVVVEDKGEPGATFRFTLPDARDAG